MKKIIYPTIIPSVFLTECVPSGIVLNTEMHEYTNPTAGKTNTACMGYKIVKASMGYEADDIIDKPRRGKWFRWQH